MNKETNSSKSEIISYSFKLNLNESFDKGVYEVINNSLKSVNSYKYGKKFKESEILKYLVSNKSKNKLLEIKKQTLTQEEKLDRWIEGYNLLNKSEISKYDFIIEVMPKLKPNDYRNFEKAADKGHNNEELQ